MQLLLGWHKYCICMFLWTAEQYKCRRGKRGNEPIQGTLVCVEKNVLCIEVNLKLQHSCCCFQDTSLLPLTTSKWSSRGNVHEFSGFLASNIHYNDNFLFTESPYLKLHHVPGQKMKVFRHQESDPVEFVEYKWVFTRRAEVSWYTFVWQHVAMALLAGNRKSKLKFAVSHSRGLRWG